MALIVTASESAEGVGLDRLFNAYNYLHRQLDGQALRKAQFPAYTFEFDKQRQLMVLESVA